MTACHRFLATMLGALAFAAPAAAQGFSQRNGATLTEVDAIAPDIVRVRVSPTGRLGEDASWAVLPAMRTARAATTAAADGFATDRLRVRVDPASGTVTVLDAAGHPVLADAAPPRFDGPRFLVTKRFGPDEHIFGLGDKTGPLDRRGRDFVLWNTDAGITETLDPTYKSIPFFLSAGGSGGAYGVLLDDTWRSAFDFGHRDAGRLTFGADGGQLDYYVIVGATPADVVRRYADLTGHPPLMPKWALGYQQSRYSYMDAGEVRGLVDRFRADRFPLDVVWLDIDFQDRNRPFTTNPATFPDFAGLVHALGQQGVKVAAITDLHIANAPNQGYRPYDEGMAGDRFVHAADGSVYSGTVWPGPAVFPDFTQDAARAWWGTLYRPFVAAGVAGFWNDMNEPSVFNVATKTMPLDAVHRIAGSGFAARTASHAEVHNVFGMENSRGTYEGLERLRPTERPFVMTRATFAGGQRWAATWTGDTSSSWAQLRLAIDMTLNLGLSGFTWTANDVGGFGGGPSPDLLTRWFQVAAFMPLFRDHATKGSPPQEPWVDGPAPEALRRAAVEERYRLFPTLYALADAAHRTGLPMMRPLFLDHPELVQENCEASAAFALGDALVAAPATYGESPAPYEACLPAGRWFDYWTDTEAVRTVKQDLFGRTERVRIVPRPDRLPVFVRAGAILAKQPLVQSLSDTPAGPLDLHVWPGPDCRGTLYDDDGLADPAARGAFQRRALTCAGAWGQAAMSLHLGAADGRWQPWWRTIRVVVHGWPAAAARAQVGGRTVPAGVDPAAHTATVTLPVAAAEQLVALTG